MLRPYAPILAFFIGLVLLCDAAVFTVHVLNDHTTAISGTPVRTTTRQQSDVKVVPSAGQAFVTGTIDKVAVDGAQVPPLATPLTLTAVERGVGKVAIEKAIVAGQRVTITWDGGTPLPISGDGGLDVGTVHVEADGSSLVYSVGGTNRVFVPGTYSLGTTVAVGTGSGLANSRDGVRFTADKDTVLAPRGDVVVRRDAQKIDLLGPGKVAITGKLKVQFPDGTKAASSVSLAEGPYRITLDTPGSGVTVDAILQGQVDAR